MIMMQQDIVIRAALHCFGIAMPASEPVEINHPSRLGRRIVCLNPCCAIAATHCALSHSHSHLSCHARTNVDPKQSADRAGLRDTLSLKAGSEDIYIMNLIGQMHSGANSLTDVAHSHKHTHSHIHSYLYTPTHAYTSVAILADLGGGHRPVFLHS